jgi:ribosomal protein L18
MVGKKIAELCSAKSISKVAFDRGGFLYHGRIQVGWALLVAWHAVLAAGQAGALT